ncbi:MAG: DUF5596 domain-containing protein [Clostridia bacterium]|nr:DUF5596 domain-containing protein [Clostridia bacterium]
MVYENAKDLMEKLEFPTDSIAELLLTLKKLLEKSEFIEIVNNYNLEDFDFSKSLEDTKTLAKKENICEYSAYMLLLLCMAPELHKRYIQKGIDDKIFYDTMSDLRYKLEECRLVHRKVGTFVPAWYKGFFEMRIFALGRLQFEINHTWFDCEINSAQIPKGTKVLSVHIPRSEVRLSHDLVLESYNKAAVFFKEEFHENIIFICNSWLLYPWNREVLKNGSNLAQFYDDFTIVSSGEYQNYSEAWRLFDCLYDGNPDNLPADTSLRRAYIERIKSGKPIGHGTGVIVFDKLKTR